MGDIRDLTGYFRALKKQLVCPKPRQAQFLAKTESMIADFRQGNLNATEGDVIEFLGDPKDLAATFLETVEPETLHRYHVCRTWLRRGLVFCVALVICALSALCIHLKATQRVFPILTVTETLTIYPEVTE